MRGQDPIPVADPGFPVGGGVDFVGGAWTPEAVTFQKICMSKRKNLDPLGGVRRARPSRSANMYHTKPRSLVKIMLLIKSRSYTRSKFST